MTLRDLPELERRLRLAGESRGAATSWVAHRLGATGSMRTARKITFHRNKSRAKMLSTELLRGHPLNDNDSKIVLLLAPFGKSNHGAIELRDNLFGRKVA